MSRDINETIEWKANKIANHFAKDYNLKPEEALLRWGDYGFLGTDTHDRRYTDIFDNMLNKGKIRQNESTIRI